ncbi:Phosphatidylserine/phosphatidylglycerophosphate/cardiolipin synthase [Variovorax sp. YR266]|uniref:phospholipase D-like domain-containing protein n=1 Tax=Variovorax sp. YR266 TaxID=1884386 RepID=UPI00089D76E4|nr:phospholipase D-like domain-containing protein [Variovorax sp. YR266]SDZ70656.1 Phosphatidylserine/phosphatidylglycerophosphate/cardiolipin synthase [Variovorax sp. YR266]
MPVKTNLLVNCDDALLFWSVAAPVSDCLGFVIDRERKLADGTVKPDVLGNRMGFKGDKPKAGEHRSSEEWPFQRLWWTDHEVNLGDTVRYRVTPMVKDGNQLKRLAAERSAWTPWATLAGGTQDGYAAFFNRGLVISQFMARYLERLRVAKGLATRKEALKAFKDSLGEHELPIRKFLSGALRTEMLALLADAKKHGKQVYGALYELADDELVKALCALGANANVVLANGSITKKKTETTSEARQRDENEDARNALNAAGVAVHDRFIAPGALGHNKFLVVRNKSGKPESAWTGSTNWTSTGLCTQTNNGLLVTHRGFAQEYFDQWERLRDAGSTFPKDLIDSNSAAKPVKTNKSSAEIWFSRTKGKVDLQALDAAVSGAKDGVLFLMFQPGGSGVLKTIRDLAKAKPALYVRGVVSTLPADAADDESAVKVDVQADVAKPPMTLDVVQPRGTNAFANWAATVARKEFLTKQGGVIGFAIVHSKVIVIDPFTNPVVITGSHNFSGNASTANDENFAIVRGNKELAASYAAHIMGVYDHYRWRALLGERQDKKDAKSLTGYLAETDAWMGRKLKSAARELKFWLN